MRREHGTGNIEFVGRERLQLSMVVVARWEGECDDAKVLANFGFNRPKKMPDDLADEPTRSNRAAFGLLDRSPK